MTSATLFAFAAPEHPGRLQGSANVDWLDPGIAWMHPLEDRQSEALQDGSIVLDAILDQLAIPICEATDYNVVQGEPAIKKLLIADMESTIIEQEMLDELAEVVGVRDRVAEITARAMAGEIDFEAAIRERVGLLAGLDAKVLDEFAQTRVTISPGAAALVATMRAQGAHCALVSGGFTHFTGPIARQLGFHEHRANRLEIADGKLTGRVVAPILGQQAKLDTLRELTARLGIHACDTIAVGDGANDLAMLRAAGLGVAYRAKPQVRNAMASHPNGVVVDHCDLRALLYLQGLRSIDIAN